MKKLFSAIFFITQLAFAQPEIAWQKTIGGSGQDFLYAIEPTVDGGYLLGGASVSGISGEKTEHCRGFSDYWVVKTDGLGTVQWQKTIGGTGNDILTDILQTTDGGFILIGRSDSNNGYEKTESSRGSTDYWIVKLDASGQISWDKTVGGNWPDNPTDVRQTTDGGYLVCGVSRSGISGDKTLPTKGSDDVWLVKLTPAGQIEWQKDYGGSEGEITSTMVATADGGWLIGTTSSSGISGDRNLALTKPFNDGWLLKVDGMGEILWQKAFPTEAFTKVLEAADGGLILAGSASGFYYLRSSSFQMASLVVKLTAGGDEIWHYRIQPVYGDCFVTDVTEAENGSIYFTSYIENMGSAAAVTKLNADGSLAWNRPIYSTPDAGNSSYVVRETDDHGIIVGMYSTGNIGNDKTEMSRGANDYWIVKFEPETLGIEATTAQLFTLSPNPVNDYLSIVSARNSACKLTIHNTAGQLVGSHELNAFEQEIAFPYASGMYFVTLTDASNGQFQTIKITKP